MLCKQTDRDKSLKSYECLGYRPVHIIPHPHTYIKSLVFALVRPLSPINTILYVNRCVSDIFWMGSFSNINIFRWNSVKRTLEKKVRLKFEKPSAHIYPHSLSVVEGENVNSKFECICSWRKCENLATGNKNNSLLIN